MRRHVRALLSAGLLAAVTLPAAAQAEPVASPAPCCEPPKVCVPRPDKKKTTKTIYGCKSEDYCLPRCTCCVLFKLFKKGCCDDCCVQCEKVRTKNVLLKKFKEEECDVVKCKPEPLCGDGRPAAPAKAAPGAKKPGEKQDAGADVLPEAIPALPQEK
jgi:hypothetical protein